MGSDQHMEASEGANQAGATPAGTIIHRKARAGRAEYQSRAMSLAKALRLTIAKVADELLDLPMGVIGQRMAQQSAEGLEQTLSEDGLLLLLDGPMRRRAGAVIDAALVGALIQQQTMGKVLPGTDGTPRRMTATDAAISAPFLDAVLARTAPLPEDQRERQLIEGYSFGARVEDARTLCMALDAAEYQMLHLTLDIAGGVRQGTITLFMPMVATDDDSDPSGTGARGGPTDPQSGQGTQKTLMETTLNLRAGLRICLSQFALPLDGLGKLQVGDVLNLENANFDKVQIQTVAGGAIGRGVLGQVENQRAVQVQTTVAEPSPLRRRASDRDALNHPDISPNIPARMDSPSRDQIPPAAVAPDLATDALSDLADPGELPPIGDLADLNDLPDMSDLPDLPDMSDLPDLPDLADDSEASALNAG